jgi:curved DNA-binding protein CbpA
VLAKVWHPDRFQGDETLRLKAEEKLKEINSAYQLLTTPHDKGAYRPSSRPAPTPEDFHRATASAPASEENSYRRPTTNPVSPPFRMRRRASRKWLAIPVTILLVCGIWIVLRYINPTSWDLWKTAATDSTAVPQTGSPTEASGNAAHSGASGQGINKSTIGSAAVAEKPGAHARSRAASPGASLVEYPSDDPLVPYFTVGSTKDDVVRVQGTPDKVTGNVFSYGLSEVYFRSGRVDSWHTDPSTPLKARMPQ